MLFANKIDFLFILLTVRTTLQFTLICGQGQNRGAIKCRLKSGGRRALVDINHFIEIYFTGISM